MRDNRDGVAIGAGRPPALVALRMDLSPRPENTSLVTQRGPRNQRAASCNPPRTKSTDGPHWGGGDRPSPCFGAPPALGRGLRHPATCAFAVHHPCCRHLGPTPKGGPAKFVPSNALRGREARIRWLTRVDLWPRCFVGVRRLLSSFWYSPRRRGRVRSGLPRCVPPTGR